MPTLEFLVPDALIPGAHFGSDAAPELLRDLVLPHLNFLAAHAAEAQAAYTLDASLASWQAWLLRTRSGVDDEANIAEIWATALGQTASTACWMIEPAFLQVGLDSVTLHDPAQLDLSPADAMALAEAARPVFMADGWELNAATPLRWFIHCNARDDDTFELHGAAIERVIGQNLSAWLPHSSSAANQLAWRRTVNEIQMTWFNHPVNTAREAAGKLSVNGLWLSGNGRKTVLSLPYTKITSTLPLLQQATSKAHTVTALETFDHFIAPVRNQDWSSWRNALQAFDLRLGEIIEAMRRDELQVLRLVLCGEHTARDLNIRRSDFWKFWRRGQALDLLIE